MYEYRNLSPAERTKLVEERLAHGYPPHSPPHPYQDQEYYLLTCTCFEHQCHISSPERRQRLLDDLFEKFITEGVEIRAWIILPNHYHLLARITDFRALGTTFRLVHGPLAREWNLEDKSPSRKVWYRFADRAIRSPAHYYTTLNYVHYNPVKHRWAESPYDWAESSVHWYLEQEGREWLRDLWTRYPVRDFGRGWDDF
ncbi:MAG: transposase [Anaerolineaceae bacterium]|nr:transposase [Anaerolineaceae bacterium]